MSRRRLWQLGLRFTIAALGIPSIMKFSEVPAVGIGSPSLRRDYCYWESRQATVINGRRWEYRCEICCAGGVCETVQCSWVDVGPA